MTYRQWFFLAECVFSTTSTIVKGPFTIAKFRFYHKNWEKGKNRNKSEQIGKNGKKRQKLQQSVRVKIIVLAILYVKYGTYYLLPIILTVTEYCDFC